MKRSEAIIVGAWLLLMGVAGFWLARHLAVTADLAAFLPQAQAPDQRLLATQLREGVASRLILVAIEGEASAAVAASRSLADRLARDARFAAVANGDPGRFAAEQALLAKHRYVLSPRITAEAFTVPRLRAALDEALRLLASPLGPAVRATLATDPTGEARAVAEALGNAGTQRATRDGVWFSDDGRRALLVVSTSAPGFDVDAQQAAARAIEQAFADVSASGLTLRMSSPGLLAAESRRIIEGDARRASGLAGALVLLLLYVVYRALRPVLLSALPALAGLLAGVFAVGLVFGEVHALTLGFGALLIGEAVDYPTYLFANNDAHETLRATALRIGRPLLLACVTTAAGALAMLASGFAGIVQLGTLTMVGVLTAGAVTRYVLPPLTPAAALAHKRVAPPRFLRTACERAPRWTWLVVSAAIVGLAVILAHRAALWEDDLASTSPVPPALKALDRELRQQAGAPDLRYLVVAHGANAQQALETSERVARRLDEAVARGMLGGYDFAARYLPSERTQRERRAALPEREQLTPALATANAGLPFRADAFAPFVEAVAQAKRAPPLADADLAGTVFAARYEALLVADAGRYAALMPLTGVRDSAVIAASLAGEPEATLLDLKAAVDGLVAGYRTRALVAALLGAAAIIAIAAIGLGSARRAIGLIAPVACGVTLTVATLLALGQRLTVFHLVSLLFVVGVGVNYALFFAFRHEQPQEGELMLLAVVVAAAASLIASIALASAATPALSAIGTTTGLGTLYSFAASAALAGHIRR